MPNHSNVTPITRGHELAINKLQERKALLVRVLDALDAVGDERVQLHEIAELGISADVFCAIASARGDLAVVHHDHVVVITE